ncbi:Uma2 family endonuclease [Streptomyces sp. TRM 70351]|uniref:Uma2 family endonuclease n=1 Tax=Streptomyces sp. TRM 70351 TaxID=3116552 RepID=UPI002E7B0B31|nr:Uma2 family endonuclease [Streptomyces sp. TRM 70351]MEE1927994.1 Uma2 family endonuclease [Streptomyces sp. TRM 70351]
MGGTMTAEPTTSWPVPPPDGYTVDDLLTLPDLPPHTELIDGSLVFVSPQRSFHTLAMYLLESGLRSTVPETLRVRREMTVVIDRRQGPEPDLCVVRAAAVATGEETFYRAQDTVLAVEVVSPDSERRDRDRKPQLYAQAGVRHFWLVERARDGGRPVVYVYELEPATATYVPTGIHHDRLKLTVPFDIDIDLTAIDRL